MRAPLDIKTDGKLTEWDGKLQAYNNVNRMFYTLSNDDDKLYLSILITDQLAIDKLLLGGLTFTISHLTTSKRKIDKNNSIITYPVVDRKTSDALRGNVHVYFSFKGNQIITEKGHLDSIIVLENKRALNLLTEIKAVSLKGIGDTILSIYNTAGVNTAIRFGNRMACTYELAIPLKCLNLSINNNGPFSYNIRLNGSMAKFNPNVPQPPVPADGEIDHEHEFDIDPTDFWAEYTLAKGNK